MGDGGLAGVSELARQGSFFAVGKPIGALGTSSCQSLRAMQAFGAGAAFRRNVASCRVRTPASHDAN